MNNHEAVVACLRQQREARQWTDESAATAVLEQLGLDPGGEAKHATVAGDAEQLTEDDVVTQEQAAYNAAQKAKDAREQLNAQQQAQGAEPTPATQPPSTHPADLAPGTMEPNLPPVPAPVPGTTEEQQPPEDPAQDKAKAKMAADRLAAEDKDKDKDKDSKRKS